MADKKRKKQKLLTAAEPSKEEMKIAKFIRFNTPKKTTVYQKQNLEYFVGSKAVDTLMTSKWTRPSKKDPALIQSRADAVKFLQQLLMNNMMYRAKKVLKESKIIKDDTNISKSSKSNKETGEDSGKARKRKTGKEEREDEKTKEKTDQKGEKKKKKKYKLDVHEEQLFLDSSDLYVWVYDPLSPKKMFLGAVVVLGIIGVTLFPLWPPEVRVGVYYLSVCGGIFVGSILAIAVCRSLLFVIVWCVTLGKHHFWFLPNLLADVGFFESFKPVYTHEVIENEKSDKNSDTEGEDERDQFPEEEAKENKVQSNEACKNEDTFQENSVTKIPSDETKTGKDDEGSEGRGSISDYEIVETNKLNED